MVIAETFQSLADGILTFVNYGITVLVLMFLYELYRFIAGPEKTPAEGAGWLWDKIKSTGKIPFTEERSEKVKRDAQRAFNQEMGELVYEKEELAIMERVQGGVKDLLAYNHDLLRLPAGYPPAEAQFRDFVERVDEVRTTVHSETRNWRGVNKTTFRAQMRINKVIEDLKKNPDVRVSEINALRADDSKILALHQKTLTKIKSLLVLLDRLHDASNGAAAATILHAPTSTYRGPSPTPGAMLFDLAEAQRRLRAANVFIDMTSLADELVQLQGMGTTTEPGVMRILEDLITRTKRII